MTVPVVEGGGKASRTTYNQWLKNQSASVQDQALGPTRGRPLGDADASRDTALRQLSGVWGASDVTGERQLMRYPPEQLYYVQGLDPSWMTEQAAADLEPYRTEDERFVLRADRQTEAEIAQGKRPSYLIILVNEDGLIEPLFNQETNKLIRMQFDPAPFMEKHRREQAKRREEFTKKNAQRQTDLRRTEGLLPAI